MRRQISLGIEEEGSQKSAKISRGEAVKRKSTGKSVRLSGGILGCSLTVCAYEVPQVVKDVDVAMFDQMQDMHAANHRPNVHIKVKEIGCKCVGFT